MAISSTYWSIPFVFPKALPEEYGILHSARVKREGLCFNFELFQHLEPLIDALGSPAEKWCGIEILHFDSKAHFFVDNAP